MGFGSWSKGTLIALSFFSLWGTSFVIDPALARDDPPPATEPVWHEYDSAEWLANWGVPYEAGASNIALGTTEDDIHWTLQVCTQQVNGIYIWQQMGTLDFALEIELLPGHAEEIYDLGALQELFPDIDTSGTLRIVTSAFAGTVGGVDGYSEHVFGLTTRWECNFEDSTQCDFEFTVVAPCRVYEQPEDAIAEAVLVSCADLGTDDLAAIFDDPDGRVHRADDDLDEVQDWELDNQKDRERWQAENACYQAWIAAVRSCDIALGAALAQCDIDYQLAANLAYTDYTDAMAEIGIDLNETVGGIVGTVGATSLGTYGLVIGLSCGGPVGALIGGAAGVVVGAVAGYYSGGAVGGVIEEPFERAHEKAAAERAYRSAITDALDIQHACRLSAQSQNTACVSQASNDLQSCLDSIPQETVD